MTGTHIRPVVGSETQLKAVVGALEAQGHVVVVLNRERIGARVSCLLQVSERTESVHNVNSGKGLRTVETPAPRRRWPYLLAGALVAVAAAVAALIWLARLLLANLPLVGGALILTLLLLYALGRTGVCVGVHCPGCRHGR